MASLRRTRIVVTLLALAAAAGFGAARAEACGSGGYSYAGLTAPARAFGVSATITPLRGFAVPSGHVAGWVGVGGPGLGPGGTDEWLQVGYSGFPGFAGNDLYYEVMRPSGRPTYHQLAANLPYGKPTRLAVLEMAGRANHWRIWLNNKPVSAPIYLPASHGRWSPIATAESWDGGSGTCNGFLYRFHGISVARVPGGGWVSLVGGYPIKSDGARIARNTHRSSFLAAQGEDAFRTLASVTP